MKQKKKDPLPKPLIKAYMKDKAGKKPVVPPPPPPRRPR